jgi:hypothetical protein
VTTEVKFIGTEAAMADLRKWADQVAPAVTKASEPFADRVADQVRGRVPVVTGQLAGSIGTSNEEGGIGVGYDGSVPYDGWIEFGGGRGRPYISEGRYLFPVAAASEDEFITVATEAATESAERFAWSTPSA